MTRLIAGCTLLVVGTAWVAGAMAVHQVCHWDGIGCIVLGCPGVLAFISGIARLENV